MFTWNNGKLEKAIARYYEDTQLSKEKAVMFY